MAQAEYVAEQQTALNEATQHELGIVMIVCRRYEEFYKFPSADSDMR